LGPHPKPRTVSKREDSSEKVEGPKLWMLLGSVVVPNCG